MLQSGPSEASEHTGSDLRILPDEKEEELNRPKELDDIQLLANEMTPRQEDLERNISSRPAPYEKLPPEILGEIFVLCNTPIVNLPPKVDEPLLILTQICQSWRELAMQVAELWASISVQFGEKETDDRLSRSNGLLARGLRAH